MTSKKLTIQPGLRAGKIRIPSSKSVAHREIIASLLSGFDVDDSRIHGWSDDLRATQTCLKLIMTHQHEWPCKESGTTLRLLEPISKALGKTGVFLKEGRLAERPSFFEPNELLKQEYKISGDISSQFISGLLFALPLMCWCNRDDGILQSSDFDTCATIELTSPLQSRSYVDLTENILKEAGILFEKPDENTWKIPGWQRYKLPKDRGVVEGDWSQAAFFMTMFQEHDLITLEGLNHNSLQGDRAIVEITANLLSGLTRTVDARQIPDIIPTLAAFVASRKMDVEFVNCERLRYKECDRLAATVEMINSVGGDATTTESGFIVHGVDRMLNGGEVKTYGDHRIAMASAVLATYSNEPIVIDNADCVSKSYPKFWDDFNGLDLLGGVV